MFNNPTLNKEAEQLKVTLLLMNCLPSLGVLRVTSNPDFCIPTPPFHKSEISVVVKLLFHIESSSRTPVNPLAVGITFPILKSRTPSGTVTLSEEASSSVLVPFKYIETFVLLPTTVTIVQRPKVTVSSLT